jgi:hypothetical protein
LPDVGGGSLAGTRIPLLELLDPLHPAGAERGTFAVFVGYIDESYDAEFFTLACLVGSGSTWLFGEWDWKRCLEATNAHLAAQGRKSLSRYRGADCSGLKNEYAGWTKDEQIELTQRLLEVFRKHPMHILSYSLNLKELVNEIPDTKPNPIGFAYVLMLYHLMIEIGDYTLRNQPDVISLIHDRCDYDAPLAEAFNHMINDPNFAYKDSFVTIAPESWQYCIPLQFADFVAHANFDEVRRKKANKNRSKALSLLLDLDSIGGRAKGITAQGLRELRKILDADEATKEILLATARVQTKKGHPTRHK